MTPANSAKYTHTTSLIYKKKTAPLGNASTPKQPPPQLDFNLLYLFGIARFNRFRFASTFFQSQVMVELWSQSIIPETLLSPGGTRRGSFPSFPGMFTWRPEAAAEGKKSLSERWTTIAWVLLNRDGEM